MSRGPGLVERALAETFARYPFKAFSVGSLCLMVWPDLRPCDVKHKHRVSVRRAATKMAAAAGWTRFAFMCGINVHNEKIVFAGPLSSEPERMDARKCFAGTKTVPTQHIKRWPGRERAP